MAMKVATTATPISPGQAAAGIRSGKTGTPSRMPLSQYVAAVPLIIRAVATAASAPRSASIPTVSRRSPARRAARMIQIEEMIGDAMMKRRTQIGGGVAGGGGDAAAR